MAFVNEAVPEEQKSKFDPKVFFNPITPNKPFSIFRWTIDRERDVFLIHLGGGGPERERPEYYALSWKGNVVKFDVVGHSEGNNEKGWVVDWTVSNVRIPPQLKTQSDEVLKLLGEGLDAMGNTICRRDNIIAVNVNFQ